MNTSTSCIIFRLTREGGPEPVFELNRVFEAAQEHPSGMTWIATRKPGAAFKLSSVSELLAFTEGRAGSALVLRARIIARHESLPADTLVRDMYEDYEEAFRAYWKITEVRLKEMVLEQLPGTTRSGKRVADAFGSQLSFAYWQPDALDDGHASLPEPQPSLAPGFAEVRRRADPLSPLHGVDFSGAHETGGRNRKIWIASWYPDRDFVALSSGGADPGFDRAGLADRILEGNGTWVIDFPFGPPAIVAAAAGWASWPEYLAWCGSNPHLKALRDQLRGVLQAAGVPWSTRRNVDLAHRTTWFPFFEQLYRQTISGGRDVLRVLDEAGRHRARILPFHEHAPANFELSVVIEGFPGWTLEQCGLPRTGYKRAGHEFEDTRRRIVNALRERGIPISDADALTAIRDTDGDTVDALVLLLAAYVGSRRTLTEWDPKVGDIEGWFFD